MIPLTDLLQYKTSQIGAVSNLINSETKSIKNLWIATLQNIKPKLFLLLSDCRQLTWHIIKKFCWLMSPNTLLHVLYFNYTWQMINKCWNKNRTITLIE
jgi:hypothetical protein